MNYSLVVATIIALVAAKPLDLPTCSVDCLKAGIEHVGCAADEADCACARANDIDPFVTPCLQGACSENESEKFRTAVVEFCANIRQPIEPTQQNIHEKFENDHWFSVASTFQNFTPSIIIVPDPSTSFEVPCDASTGTLSQSVTVTGNAPPYPAYTIKPSTTGATATETGLHKPTLPAYTNTANCVMAKRAVVAGMLGLIGSAF